MHHTSGFLRSTLSTITMNFHALALFRRLNAGSIMTSFLGILLLQQQGHQPLINLHKIDGRISPVVTCTFPVKLTERTLRKAVTASPGAASPRQAVNPRALARDDADARVCSLTEMVMPACQPPSSRPVFSEKHKASIRFRSRKMRNLEYANGRRRQRQAVMQPRQRHGTAAERRRAPCHSTKFPKEERKQSSVACASRRCSLYHLQKKLIRLQMQALYLLAACLGLLLGSTTSVHGCRGRGHTDPLDGWQIGSS